MFNCRAVRQLLSWRKINIPIIWKGIKCDQLHFRAAEFNETNPACKISQNFFRLGTVFGATFVLNLFKKRTDEENPEDILIKTIKRCILCIQRQNYDKAEQMLHLALRMAQDMQSNDGIMYVFDVMANLAMEREQYNKAEKLFADVMQRLFTEGYTEDSPKILHISSKIAHMAQQQGELEKAEQGFKWTLTKIEEIVKKMPEDKDLKELFGLTKNW